MFDLLKNILLIFGLLEIISFILVAKWLGLGTALLLIIISAACGIALLRKASESTLQVAQQLHVGAWQELAAARYVLAGLLLIIPGFISDIVGLLCLAPIVHNKMLDWLQKKQKVSANDHYYQTNQHQQHKEPRIIEGEFWREDDKGPQP